MPKKRIKRKVSLGSGVEYDGQMLFYENYKEPLKKIEKAVGHGYYGTVGSTQDGMYLQCHVCGNLYESLGQHIQKHNINAREYKEKFQLNITTALVGEKVRQRKQESTVKPGNKGLPAHLKEYNEQVQSGAIKHNGNGGRKMTLETRNKLGVCPDQLLEKIKELEEIKGYVPSYEEFVEHFEYHFIGAIKYVFGGWSKAVHQAGLVTRKELRHPDKQRLVEELQFFHKRHKRIPMTSDFNRGLLRDRGVYIRQFGSLNNARIEAGLNAVIPMPFGQIVELTPAQYMEYKAGHEVPGIISKQAVQKRSYRKSKRRRLLGIAK